MKNAVPLAPVDGCVFGAELASKKNSLFTFEKGCGIANDNAPGQ
ncbi:MAG: hypothetical protein CM15mP62_27860 [Rhodospirillaceae bacterium]|nr:MAG: hypothetical protein CM15mP62_27860 [Rhodospirillaceae bacterium]